jgi:hypothetical protein
MCVNRTWYTIVHLWERRLCVTVNEHTIDIPCTGARDPKTFEMVCFNIFIARPQKVTTHHCEYQKFNNGCPYSIFLFGSFNPKTFGSI